MSENGIKFTSMAIPRRVQNSRNDWHFIAPGLPTQNAFIESLKDKLRNECLTEKVFSSLAEAWSTLEELQYEDTARRSGTWRQGNFLRGV